MERILVQLRAAADDDDDDVLRDTIAILTDIQRHPDGPHAVSWDALQRNFQLLRDRGFWESSVENDQLLDVLRVLLTSKNAAGQNISIVIPPAHNLASQFVANQDHHVLPTGLIDILNNAYLLHTLATDPALVLPPGKSLLSVLSQPHTTADEETKPVLHSKVEDFVHKAFWDEALETLSSPEPSVQLPRIKLLYSDLYATLSPLLPPKHPVLVTLSSPFSPTSSPLDSALVHLREVLASLHERCAPVRDPVIVAYQQLLDDPPIRPPRHVALAKLVTETIRNVLRLSEIMKDDLSQFVLGNMTEQQLASVVFQQAREKEREIVIDIWHRDRITQEWVSWPDRLNLPMHLSSISMGRHISWIAHVVQALGLSSPVICPLPMKTVEIHPVGGDSNETTEHSPLRGNALPPVFFFSAPALLKAQNYLQALLIAASLRSLTRLPAHPQPFHGNPDAIDTDSFMSRVWTLLRAEIAGEPGASDTKIIHLADEVVRAQRQAATAFSVPDSKALSEEEEKTLRAAVNRTLRIEDPVYKVLQRRLLAKLCDALVECRQRELSRGAGATGPTTLRTGRDGERVGKRPRLMLNLEDMNKSQAFPRSSPWKTVGVKGFEDPVLSRAIAEVFGQVDRCLEWVENVWGDVVETGKVQDNSDQEQSIE